MLRSWFTGPELPLRVPEGLATKDIISAKAPHVDAFCHGTAFSMAVEEFPTWLHKDFPDTTDYSAGVIA